MGIKVDTPNGGQNFIGVKRSLHDSYYHIVLYNGDVIECSTDHIFDTDGGGILAKNITKKDEVNTKSGHTFIKSKRKIKKKVYMYDLVGVENGSIYYTNGIASHNCDFLGSSNTLLENSTIKALVYKTPLVEENNLQIYEQPKKGHVYVATADVSGGIGSDYSVLNIMDVTTSPYKQVLVYRSNLIDPTDFASVISNIGKKYNTATVVVELNNDGKLTAKELWELEYDNLISTASLKGENVIKGGKTSNVGILMTTATKKNGCARLKDLMETYIIIIQNDHTVSEFSTFIRRGNSYEADVGKNDDCVMTLVMFAWFTTTVYFEDLCGGNVRDIVNSAKDYDDLHTLVGFVNGEDDYNENYEFQSSLW